MLGKPTSHALDIGYTPLHPRPRVALDQTCLLQGCEQAMSGHLAARASLASRRIVQGSSGWSAISAQVADCRRAGHAGETGSWSRTRWSVSGREAKRDP